MIILVINEYDILAIEAKGKPPIPAYRHRIPAGQIAGQGMQPPSRHVHIRRRFGQVKPGELPTKPSRMVRLDTCLAATFKKRLQPLVPERLNHTTTLYSVAFHMSTRHDLDREANNGNILHHFGTPPRLQSNNSERFRSFPSGTFPNNRGRSLRDCLCRRDRERELSGQGVVGATEKTPGTFSLSLLLLAHRRTVIFSGQIPRLFRPLISYLQPIELVITNNLFMLESSYDDPRRNANGLGEGFNGLFDL